MLIKNVERLDLRRVVAPLAVLLGNEVALPVGLLRSDREAGRAALTCRSSIEVHSDQGGVSCHVRKGC